MGPSFVQKNEDFTADRAPFQLVGHQSAQSIEAFAHITRFVVKQVPVLGIQAEHYTKLINWRILWASKFSSRSRTPLG